MGCWVTRAVFMSLHFFSFSSHFICSKWIQLQASNKNNHIFSGLRLINWKSLVNPVDRLLKWSRCLLEDWVSDAGSSDLRRALLRTLLLPWALSCSLRAQASLFPPSPSLLCQGDASEPDSYVRRDVREGLEGFSVFLVCKNFGTHWSAEKDHDWEDFFSWSRFAKGTIPMLQRITLIIRIPQKYCTSEPQRNC